MSSSGLIGWRYALWRALHAGFAASISLNCGQDQTSVHIFTVRANKLIDRTGSKSTRCISMTNRTSRSYVTFFALALILGWFLSGWTVRAEPRHGLAMIGDPALPPDFTQLPYANPDAPKRGRIRYGMVGTFDSLNPFILKGVAPRGLADAQWGDNINERLMFRSFDEPFTMYGLLAEKVETPEDRSWVEFTLNPKARFSDGKPVRPEDVIFSFHLLKDKARPRGWHKKIADVVKVGELGVRFNFADGSDRELPLIVSLMHVFPEHATDPEEFGKSSLKPLVGSGPYLVEKVDPGRKIILRKNPDYWGSDLPVKAGMDNFDEISVEYFRDQTTFEEAFRKGIFDVTIESDPKRWKRNYSFPAVENGDVILENVASGTPKGMSGYVLNLRNPVFQDARVRRALGLFLDFEWMNKNLYFNLYSRNSSYFEDSELSAIGRSASLLEEELLKPYPDVVSSDVLDGSYRIEVSDGSGRDRKQIRKALALLADAGFVRKGNQIVDQESGKPLTFEVLILKAQERVAVAWKTALAVAGINISVRVVDASQYWERLKNFEYDVIQWYYSASLSPGNEQYGRWSSAAADQPGTWNFAGVKSPAVDAMIDAVLSARTRDEFVSAVRAYDRVLISGNYVVPLFYAPETWYARWKHINRPPNHSLYGAQPTTWWFEE